MVAHTQRSTSEVLEEWRVKACIARDAHYKQAKILQVRHIKLGVPVVVLSTLVGTSIFASLEHAPLSWVKVLVGLLSISCSVLAALQTFHNYSQQSERHRATAIRFSAIVRKIEVAIAECECAADIPSAFAKEVEKELNDISAASPLAPMDLWLATSAEFGADKDRR